MEDNANLSDALVLVQLRNAMYRKRFHFILGVFALSLIVICILLITFFYLQRQMVQPRYFVADQTGRLIQDIPLSELNMTMSELVAWTEEAVESANSFDFVNYRQQLQTAQRYFTDDSWATYMKELTISDNLLALTNRHWVFVAKIIGKPTLLAEGVLGGVRAYKFEMPMLVTYLKPPTFAESTSSSNAFVVTVIVVRRNLLESYKGLAIYSMVIRNAPEGVKKLDMPQ